MLEKLFHKKKEEKVEPKEESEAVCPVSPNTEETTSKRSKDFYKTQIAKKQVSKKRQMHTKTRLRGGAAIHRKVNKNEVFHFLRKPILTEKAALLSEKGVYTFSISSKATKANIKQAIKEEYKVVPNKVRIVTTPVKAVRLKNARTNRVGVKGGGKKAYVYLEKGDKIKLS